jgi:hypothetical protein
MPKIYPEIHSFTGGMLSPRLEGRIDFAKYGIGCRVLENFIVTPTGGIYKRPGTRFVARAKQKGVRLVPFDFNGTERQSYVLEFGNGYVRFFTRGGQLMLDGAPFELPCPALAGIDLTDLQYVQSADVIYFAHPKMKPWRLERLANTSWAYQPLEFLVDDDWPLPFTGENYPSQVRIYEDRLVYAATPQQPVNIWMSRLGDYTDFRINTAADQTDEPLATDAIFLRLNGSRVNPIMWMLDMEQLLVGTNASEIRIQGADIEAPLTPQTTGHKRQSSYGSSKVQAIMLGASGMFVSRTGRNVYALDYQDLGYRFRSAPINLLCQEATDPGVVEMHSMSDPEPIAWCILSDGAFAGCTYIRDQQVYAWHRHSTQGKVISGAVIPWVEGDQFWLAVERGDACFIEYLEAPFDPCSDDATYSVFMDAMLSGVIENQGQAFGMAHMPGASVQLMCDGSYRGEMTVTDNGEIIDDSIRSGSYVVAGLGYEARMQPMRVNYQMQNGSGVSFKKRVVSVVLRVLGSIKGEVRAEYAQAVPATGDAGEFGQWQEIVAFPHGATGGKAPPCRSENIEVSLSGNSSYDGLISVRQALPFPMFLISLSYGIEQGR